MADNLIALANTGTGTDVLATDEIDSVHYPRTKIGFGNDGSYGDVSAENRLPVTSDRLESLIALMARMVKMMESNAIVDSAQRQRVVVDAGTVTTVTGVTTVSTVSAVTLVSNVTAQAGMDREQYINISKQTSAQSIRARLTFA
jgi:alkylhydroperoxidase family enzyme